MRLLPTMIALLVSSLILGSCSRCGDPPASPGELEYGSAPRLEQPRVDDADRIAHRQGGRDFAFSLLAALGTAEERENVVFSPYAIRSSIARISAGTAGDTERELRQAAHLTLPDEELHQAFNELDLRLHMHAHEVGFRFRHPSAIVIDETRPVEATYLNQLTRHYSSGIHRLDLDADPAHTQEALNQWIGRQTHGDIRALFTPSSISSKAPLIAADALQFAAPWHHEFQTDRSQVTSFQTLNGADTTKTMMRGGDGYRWVRNAHTAAAAVPYAGGNLFFIAMMPAEPTDDFLAWERDLDRRRFDEIVDDLSGLQQGQLHIPRFELASALDLQPPLATLGANAVFDGDRADFSVLVGDQSDASIWLDTARHGAAIAVDEQGTGEGFSRHAMASDDLGIESTDHAPTLIFDRPFYFAVYDEGAQTILLLGRLVN